MKDIPNDKPCQIEHIYITVLGRKFKIKIRKLHNEYYIYCFRFGGLMATDTDRDRAIDAMKDLIEIKCRFLLKDVIKIIDGKV